MLKEEEEIDVIIIDKDEIHVKSLLNIFNRGYKPFKFFYDYAFLTYFTFIHENEVFISLIKDYSREPINIRKGMKAHKKFKKRNYKKQRKAWLPIALKYHRSNFTKKGCLLNDTELLKIDKIKLLNFFFKWQKKRTRAYSLTQFESNEEYLTEGDEYIINFYCYRASFKKIISNLNKNEKILPDYEKIRRIAHPMTFKFKFFDLDKNNQDLMFDFRGNGYDDCTLLIICNTFYFNYFEDFKENYDIAIDWQLLVVNYRTYSLTLSVYQNKHNFLFEFWKAYKMNYWFRKYWDPEWPKIIGEILYKIRFYRRENIINTKRIEKKVSREEAIRLVEEDRLRAKAENIILKKQMQEKLAVLEWYDNLNWANRLVEEGKKPDLIEALKEVSILRVIYARRTAEIIAMNQKIAKKMILEEKKKFEPKKRDLRIFINYK